MNLRWMYVIKKRTREKIQLLRKRNKITQEKLADMIKIDPKNVSKIENGINYPNPDTLSSIACALNIDIYELFVFKKQLPIDAMRDEIINSLDDTDMVIYLYELLKCKL